LLSCNGGEKNPASTNKFHEVKWINANKLYADCQDLLLLCHPCCINLQTYKNALNSCSAGHILMTKQQANTGILCNAKLWLTFDFPFFLSLNLYWPQYQNEGK